MINSILGDTAERERRYDDICRSWRYEFSDMCSTDRVDITELSILVPELYDSLWIILYDNEPRSRRLVSEDISCHLSISSTELYDSMSISYISQCHETAYEEWTRPESVSDI
jgi:hypothetical protein